MHSICYSLCMSILSIGRPTKLARSVRGVSLRASLVGRPMVYHYSIPEYLSKSVERVQRRALRIIYGYDYSYKELLSQSKLTTLSERRSDLLNRNSSIRLYLTLKTIYINYFRSTKMVILMIYEGKDVLSTQVCNE